MTRSLTSSYASLFLQFPLGPSLDYMIKKINKYDKTPVVSFFFYFSVSPSPKFSLWQML